MSASSDTDEILAKWQQEQSNLKKNLIMYDTEAWQVNRRLYSPNDTFSPSSNESLRYVAGLDISFVKDRNTACSGLFVFDIANNMQLVYKDLDEDLIEMDQPYIPGYLAYREAPFLLSKLEKLKKTNPSLYPQCILIDGNGVLHRNKFGMACHIGMLTDTPSIGVSKKLCQVFGLENNAEHKEKQKECLKNGGDYFELLSDEEEPCLLGYAYRATQASTNPIYVSVGHKISWATALWVVAKTVTKYRIPEPVRQADLITREYLRSLGF